MADGLNTLDGVYFSYHALWGHGDMVWFILDDQWYAVRQFGWEARQAIYKHYATW